MLLHLKYPFSTFSNSFTIILSVTNGVAAREKADGPVVQLTMASNVNASSFIMPIGESECPIALYVDSELVSDVPAGDIKNDSIIKNDSFELKVNYRRRRIFVQFEKMKLELHARRPRRTAGQETDICLFNVNYVLQEGCRMDEDLVGLLGSPNQNPLDDWTDREGNVYDFPDHVSRNRFISKEAYDYSTDNWCITEASESIFTYEEGESHAFYEHCTDKYEPIDCEVTPEIHEKCKGDLTCELEVCIMGEEELEEIEIIKNFLPRQLDEGESRAAVESVINELQASGLKDMGRVMGELKARYTGQMDFGKVSSIVKDLLG